MNKEQREVHLRVEKGASAFHGFALILSAIAAFFAWLYTPTGLMKLAVDFGWLAAPLAVRVAPVFAVLAMAAGAVYGLARIWSWVRS